MKLNEVVNHMATKNVFDAQEPQEDVSMAGKRSDERFGKDQRNDLVAAGDNAESWSSVFTAWLILLFIASAVEGSMACEVDQVKVGTKINYTCVSCVDCPHGMEPSIACGGHGLVLECTPCKPGTFSSAFDKRECRPCTICDDKLTVLQNCTSQSNSKCGGCRRGYYRHDFIPDCLPCSPCCGDGQDVHPPECKTLKGMQCERRHSDCPPAGVRSPVAPGTTVTPVSPKSTPDTFTTQPRPGEQLIPLTENHDTKDKPTEKSKSQAAAIISVATVLPVLAVVIVIVYRRRQYLPCLRAQSLAEEGGGRSDCKAEKERGVRSEPAEIAMIDDKKSTSQESRNTDEHTCTKLQTGIKPTLRDLEHKSPDTVDIVCSDLDQKNLSSRRYCELLAAKFEKVDENQRHNLKISQNPSKDLIDLLLTHYAGDDEITVEHFAKMLNKIGRKDTAKKLQSWILQEGGKH